MPYKSDTLVSNYKWRWKFNFPIKKRFQEIILYCVLSSALSTKQKKNQRITYTE